MTVVSDLTRKVSYNYFIKEKYEAGVILFGWEVKCIRINGISLVNSFVSIDNFFRVVLFSSVVNTSSFIFNYCDLVPDRDRFLLLKKRQIIYLRTILNLKGYTLIPSKAYWKNSFLKLELSLCLGKKLYDKRQVLKNRELNSDIFIHTIN